MAVKDWKKKDLADALGKNPSVITKWLSGTHNFTSDTLADIGNVLHIDLLNIKEKPKEIVEKYNTIVVAGSTSMSASSLGIIETDLRKTPIYSNVSLTFKTSFLC